MFFMFGQFKSRPCTKIQWYIKVRVFAFSTLAHRRGPAARSFGITSRAIRSKVESCLSLKG